jgi:hypothetical protein
MVADRGGVEHVTDMLISYRGDQHVMQAATRALQYLACGVLGRGGSAASCTVA